MKIAIMQPYFLPYIGYWQLLKDVDKFVVYDDIEYTKKGWINRNRYLCEGKDKYFTIPLKQNSDYLTIKERELATDFDSNKVLNKLLMAYKRAPNYEVTQKLIQKIFDCKETNLFNYLFNSINLMKQKLNINTEIIISSELNIENKFKNNEKVKKICMELNADQYVNPIGGTRLYDKEDFKKSGIELFFIKTNENLRYKQMTDVFIENLSIIDVMMFNDDAAIGSMMNDYELI